MGNDFWLGFMKGRIEASMSVTITGLRACTGTISNEWGWSQTFSVPAGGSVTIVIDTSRSYNYVSNGVTNKGIHVVTSDTVSVYASNFLSSSFDVTYVLPTEVLRDEYMVQTFETWRMEYQSEILIVATEDTTVVDIYPEASTLGSTVTGNFNVTLHRGQCYFMQCGEIGDYSGTRIKARDCKKIAVFNGHHCAHVPVTTGLYCDHLFEQSIPTAYWGKRFVATMSSHHNGDYIKVTALKDNCVVSVGGSQVATINAGESYAMTLNGSSTSRYIETSKPATVYAYMVSKNVGGPDGDPSMVLIPPIEQQLKDVVFVSYNNTGQLTQYHYMNVVASSEDAGLIYFDGSSIGSSFSPVTGNSEYSFARVSMNPGSHRLYSLGQHGFVAHAYGVGSNESYGYAVGFSANDLNRRLVVNNTALLPGDTVRVCAGDTVVAYIRSDDSLVVSGWYKDGASCSAADTLAAVCTSSGTSSFSVVFSVPNSCFSIVDTMSFVLVVNAPQETGFDTAACDGITWNNTLYDITGEYEHVYTDGNGCDSTVRMHLTINNTSYGSIVYSGCDSVMVNGIVYYGDDTVVMEVLTGANGCDSVVTGFISVNPSYDFNVYVDITYGDTVHWIDGGAYCDEGERPSYNFHSVDGCDSIVHLNIHVTPPEDSSAIWVPNAFTPAENGNNMFWVFGNDIIKMHVYIFNRWGNYVTDFDGLTESWDGTHNGEPCKEDAYVYLIEYTTKAMPKCKARKVGAVTLIR